MSERERERERDQAFPRGRVGPRQSPTARAGARGRGAQTSASRPPPPREISAQRTPERPWTPAHASLTLLRVAFPAGGGSLYTPCFLPVIIFTWLVVSIIVMPVTCSKPPPHRDSDRHAACTGRVALATELEPGPATVPLRTRQDCGVRVTHAISLDTSQRIACHH